MAGSRTSVSESAGTQPAVSKCTLVIRPGPSGKSKTEEAFAEMQKEMEPFWRGQGLALAYHAAGKKKEADAALADYIEKYQNEWAFQIAEIYAYRGETDKAFEWLERAYKQRDGGLAEMKGDPMLPNIERDPRYRAFLQKMKIPLD